jgi:hypothetical protein
MAAAPGNNYNPNGRPVGSKNLLTWHRDRAFEIAKERGYPHPALAMLEIAYDEKQPIERRDMMLIEAARYFVPKPKSVHPVEIDIPSLSSDTDLEGFLATLIMKFKQDLEPLELSTMVKQLIDAKRSRKELELKQISVEGGPSQQTIRIEGGLDPLPLGPDDGPIRMPKFNGHPVAAGMLAAPVDAAPDPLPTDSVQVKDST